METIGGNAYHGGHGPPGAAPPLAEPASLFDPEDTDAKERAIADAEVDDVALADVKRWLQSWGKADELPPPPWQS